MLFVDNLAEIVNRLSISSIKSISCRLIVNMVDFLSISRRFCRFRWLRWFCWIYRLVNFSSILFNLSTCQLLVDFVNISSFFPNWLISSISDFVNQFCKFRRFLKKNLVTLNFHEIFYRSPIIQFTFQFQGIKSDTNTKMLEDAFALLAYPNPWESPVGWQLSPNEREFVSAALNSSLLEAGGYPSRPPLEVGLSHAKQLVKLMSNHDLGACAFANLEDLIKNQPQWIESYIHNYYVKLLKFSNFRSFLYHY